MAFVAVIELQYATVSERHNPCPLAIRHGDSFSGGICLRFFGLRDLEEFAGRYGYDVRDILIVFLPMAYVMVVFRLLKRLQKFESSRPNFEVGPLDGLSQHIDLVVQNMTGPMAVVSVNCRPKIEMSSGYSRQNNLQNRTLPPRDIPSDRIEIMKGQAGIYQLCRLNTDTDAIEFAVVTPAGTEWISGGKNDLYRIEIDVNSDPPSKTDHEYLFRLVRQPPSPFLWLQYVDNKKPSGKTRLANLFWRILQKKSRDNSDL